MKKIKCFVIKEKEIFLFKTLVDVNGFPIFYICNDECGHFYIALCYDMEELKYIVAPVSRENIYRMLTAEITMRDFVKTATCFYEIQAGNTTEEDFVEERAIDKIDEGILPVEDAYFEAINDKLKEFVNSFCDEGLVYDHIYEISYVTHNLTLEYSNVTFKYPSSNFKERRRKKNRKTDENTFFEKFAA